MRKLNAILLWTFLAALLLNPSPAFSHQLRVFVSILPQKYFVQQIGGDLVNVQVMVPPGADPHTYEPKPSQMQALADTKIYFAIGVNFEQAWLDKFSSTNPEMKIVHTDEGIDKIPMTEHSHHEEEDQPGEAGREHRSSGQQEQGHHEHGILDPHVWLSPPLVKIQARHILDALVEADSTNATAYRANFAKFITQIDALDAEFKHLFADKQGMEFMVYHPAWGYFAHAYGLKQVPIEIEGKEPKPAQLKELIEHARERHIKVIFVQPQLSSRNAETIAKAIGGQIVFADPLAFDWAANLQRQAASFDAAGK